MQKLNNILLKHDCIKEEIKDGTERYVETTENDNTTYQNFWDAARAIVRGKWRLLQAYLKKEEKVK